MENDYSRGLFFALLSHSIDPSTRPAYAQDNAKSSSEPQLKPQKTPHLPQH